MYLTIFLWFKPDEARVFCILALLSCLGACSTSLPPIAAPEVPAQWLTPLQPNSNGVMSASNLANSQSANKDLQWWQSYTDPQLMVVQEQVALGNAELKTSLIRVAQAANNLAQEKSNLWPTISASLSSNAAKPLSGGEQKTSKNYSSSFSVGYELDLWGKLAQQVQNGQTAYQASAWDAQAARLTLQGQAAEIYWQIAALKAQQLDAQAQLVYLERLQTLVQSRFRAGSVAGADRYAAHSSLLAAQRRNQDLQQQLLAQEYALALLAGHNHQSYRPAIAPMRADATLPAALAAPTPASVIQNRPDLQAAFARLGISAAQVDLAHKAFLPGVTLSAGLSSGGDAIAQWLRNPAGSLAASILLPFMDWGRKNQQLKGKELDYEQAALEYQQKVYNALKEAEQALDTAQTLAKQYDSAVVQWQLAQKSEQAAQSRYRAGASDVQPWLDALQGVRDARAAVITLRHEQLKNSALLYRVLGGSKENTLPPIDTSVK